MKKNLYLTGIRNIILIIFLFLTAIKGYSQTAIWTGASNNDWNNSTNWDIASIPNSSYDIIITSSYTNKLIIHENVTVNNITIQPNGEIDVLDGGNLYVSKNFKLYGTLNMNNGYILVSDTWRAFSNSEIITGDGTLDADVPIFDTLSIVHFTSTNPYVFNWRYSTLIIDAPQAVQLTGTSDNPTICDSLILNSVLVISENKSLEVIGGINLAKKSNLLYIEAGSSDAGSLLHNSPDVIGQVDIVPSKKNGKSYEWHYLSTPVSDQVSTSFYDPLYEWNASMSWGGLGDYSPWQTTSDNYMQRGKGYAIHTNPYSISFYGHLNNGTFQVHLYKNESGNADDQGWNLVGNPYVAPIDWDKVVLKGDVPAGAENAIYFYQDVDGSGSQANYRYYVPSTGGTYGVGTENANQYIPVCQGFMIKTNTNNVVLKLKNEHRKSAQANFYKTEMKAAQIIDLTITDGTNFDEVIYRIIDNATLAFDANYDARKLFPSDNTMPLIYSVNPNNETSSIAINSIPNPDKYTVLNLGISGPEGTYTINLKNLSVDSKYVYLVDNYTNTTIDLKQTSSYSFKHDGSKVSDRFTLTFASTATNVQQTQNVNIEVYPNPTTDFINIDLQSEISIGNAQIYSTNGMLVKTTDLNSGNNKIDVTNLAKGMYIMKIFIPNQKTIINKIAVK